MSNGDITRKAPDLLELGMALVIARPRLRKTIARLTLDPDRAENLLQAVLSRMWSARDVLRPTGDVYDTAVGVLKTKVLN